MRVSAILRMTMMIVLVLAVTLGVYQAQDGGRSASAMPSQVTAVHKELKSWVGDWDLEFEYWGDPNSDQSIKWSVRVKREMLEGDLYLRETYDLPANIGGGTVTWIYSYNPHSKHMIVNGWGTTNPVMHGYEGAWNADKDVWVIKGGFDAAWGRISDRLEVTKPSEEGVQTMINYGSGKMPDGTEVKDWKHMVLTYKRRTMNMDQEAAMAAASLSMTPNDVHEGWKSFLGTWHYDMKWNMPDGSAFEVSGVSNYEMELGRYLTESASYNMYGAPASSISTWAYDTSTETYQFTYRSNMQTGMFYFEGKQEGDKIVMYGKGWDGVNERWYPTKSISPAKIDGQSFTAQLHFDLDLDGEWEPTGTFTYSRFKALGAPAGSEGPEKNE